MKKYLFTALLVILALVIGSYTYLYQTSSIEARGYISINLYQTSPPQQVQQIQTGDSLERRYYFTTIIGDGRYKNPYRSKVTNYAHDWGMLDLRPDPTVQEGYALAFADTTKPITGDPEVILIVADLTDSLQSSKLTFLNFMFDTNIESTSLSDFTVKLLTGKQKLRPGTDGEYRIFLGGQIFGKPKPIYEQGTIADNFTGGAHLTWVEPVGGFNFVNNQAESADEGENIAYADEAEPTSDAHYSQCTREDEAALDTSAGVAVRVEVGGQTDCYMFLADTDTPEWQIYERFDGGYTKLTSGGAPGASSGQVLYLEQDSGDNLVGKEDGNTKLTVTDSTITGNTHAGIRAWNADKDLDNFEAADLVACSPDISNTLASYGFGTLAEGASANTGLDYFTVVNSSGGTINITIQATDMVGGNTWTCTDNGTAGDMKVGFRAGLNGTSYNITVKKSAPFNYLVDSLANSANQTWGLQLNSPYNYTDGIIKSGNVTLTATCE